MRAVAIWLMFLPLAAFPISKVGNSSIGNNQTGFEVQMPYPFLNAQALKSNAVRLNSVIPEQEYDPAVGFIQSYIEAQDYAQLYPEYHFSSRDVAREWFLDHGWTEIHTPYSCMFAAKIEKPAGITVVTSWGPLIGAVFYGPNRTVARQALEGLPSQIVLQNGSCQW